MAEQFDPERLIEAMEPLSLRAVARRIGVDPSNLCRPLTALQADRYAVALGLHPGAIWGAQWWRPDHPTQRGRATVGASASGMQPRVATSATSATSEEGR